MNDNINCGIYKITNITNGKFYIGSSKRIDRRIYEHLRELRSNIHHSERLQHSFNKYGEKNFEFEVIEYVSNDKDLIEREQYWIDSTKCYDKNIGFNICQYASGGGVWGEANGNYGNKGIKNPLSKQIAQIDANTLEVIKVWGASIDIKRELEFHGGCICKVCIHLNKYSERKKYKGFYWCYEKDLELFMASKDYVHKQKREVLQICLVTNKILNTFSSIVEAANHVNVGAENISRVCVGKHKTCAGYKWAFKDASKEVASRRIKSLNGGDNPRARKVKATQNGKEFVFSCINDCMEHFKVSLPITYSLLKSGEPYELKPSNNRKEKTKHLVGLKLEYVNNNTNSYPIIEEGMQLAFVI